MFPKGPRQNACDMFLTGPRWNREIVEPSASCAAGLGSLLTLAIYLALNFFKKVAQYVQKARKRTPSPYRKLCIQCGLNDKSASDLKSVKHSICIFPEGHFLKRTNPVISEFSYSVSHPSDRPNVPIFSCPACKQDALWDLRVSHSVPNHTDRNMTNSHVHVTTSLRIRRTKT